MYGQDLKDFVVVPTLESISKYVPNSHGAINLVLGTGAQESNFHYLDQTPKGPGPGFGIYQCERISFNTVWKWLQRPTNFELFMLVKEYELVHLDNCEELHGNLYLATIICRLHYFLKPGELPGASDVPGMAAYWKRWYNTSLGAGTEAEFIANYKKYVAPLK
jgi:hypothetical protein